MILTRSSLMIFDTNDVGGGCQKANFIDDKKQYFHQVCF